MGVLQMHYILHQEGLWVSQSSKRVEVFFRLAKHNFGWKFLRLVAAKLMQLILTLGNSGCWVRPCSRTSRRRTSYDTCDSNWRYIGEMMWAGDQLVVAFPTWIAHWSPKKGLFCHLEYSDFIITTIVEIAVLSISSFIKAASLNEQQNTPSTETCHSPGAGACHEAARGPWQYGNVLGPVELGTKMLMIFWYMSTLDSFLKANVYNRTSHSKDNQQFYCII